MFYQMTAGEALASEPQVTARLIDNDGGELADDAKVTLNESNEYCIGWPPDNENDIYAWSLEQEWLPLASEEEAP